MTRDKGNDLPDWLENVVAKEEKARRQAVQAAERRAAAENHAEIMPIAERFVSVNGEGPRSGRLAAFIRFAGCNLRCAWCDTAWAQGSDSVSEWRTTEELVRWVREAGVECVTLTGGEPLLQPGAAGLVEALVRAGAAAADEGGATSYASLVERASAAAEEPPAAGPLFVEIETNGSQPIRPLAALRDRLAEEGLPGRFGFTLDCKLPASGEARAMNEDNYALLGADDVVKFVIAEEDDLDAMLAVVEAHGLGGRCGVYLSPIMGAVDPAVVVDFMRDHAMAYATLQLQLHKIIWPGVERGV